MFDNIQNCHNTNDFRRLAKRRCCCWLARIMIKFKVKRLPIHSVGWELSWRQTLATQPPTFSRSCKLLEGKSRKPKPDLPYWYLQSDGLWEIPGAEYFPKGKCGRPGIGILRTSQFWLWASFENRQEFLNQIVTVLLDEHCLENMHSEITMVIGLNIREAEKSLYQQGISCSRA